MEYVALNSAVQAGIVSAEWAREAMWGDCAISTASPPVTYVQSGYTGGRAKCEHCGQWGERFFQCSECGAPID